MKASGARRGVSWEELASSLPGLERGVCFGTPALYVRKRFLARLKEDGGSVAIKVDLAERDVLLEADPKAFYLTDHYRPYPMVLMRLAHVRRAVALELLEAAWRRVAPKRLVAERAAANRSGQPTTPAKPRRKRDPGP